MEYSSFRDESAPLTTSEQEQSTEYIPFSRPIEQVVTAPQVQQAPVSVPSAPPVSPDNPQAPVAVIGKPKAPSFKAVLFPILGYVAVFAVVLLFGAFNPEGSAGYNAAINILVALVLIAPIYIVVVLVRFFRLKKKAKQNQ